MQDNKGRFYGLGRGTNKARIDYYREQLAQLGLGLEDKLHVKVGSLSGGQRQAMALLMSTMTPIEFLTWMSILLRWTKDSRTDHGADR